MSRLPGFLFFAASVLAAAEPVFYRDFGAKGDGVTNDFAAIVKAHEFANKNNRPVRAEDGAVYYVGDTDATAVIQTDTDWGKARFVIDDRAVTKRFDEPLFRAGSKLKPFPVKNLKPLKYGQTELGVKLPCKALVIVKDHSIRRFVRYGVNASRGSFQEDAILADENGKIDPETPVNWDCREITSATAYPVDKDVLTIRGGTFTTIDNARPWPYRYFSRNLKVNRSNTVIEGVRHEVVNAKGRESWPYAGFISVTGCAMVTVRNCGLSGRKIYDASTSAEKRVRTGTYDLYAGSAVRLYFNRIRQINSITDTSLWGIMGTNLCKAVHLQDCRISRFDAHQGVTNASIRSCELGHQGINAIGFGTFTVENTTSHAANFINFREDYGSMWKGKFLIRNCVFAPEAKFSCIFNGHGNPDHDFGYPCCMPEEITVEGLSVRLPALEPRCALFADFDFKKINDKAPHPYIVTKVLNVRDLKVEGGPLIFSRNPAMFKELKINGILPAECTLRTAHNAGKGITDRNGRERTGTDGAVCGTGF